MVARAQDEPAPLSGTAPIAEEGPWYPVNRFVIRYLHRGHPGHPPRERIMRLEVTLGKTGQGYVAPRAGVPSVTFRLEDVEARPVERYAASAVQTILQRIRDFLADRQLLGIYVAPDPEHISATGVDLRNEQQTSLRLLVTTSIATQIRTLASGQRIDPDEQINNPLHARIVERSPIRPYAEGDPERVDLLNRKALDDYTFWLSRHPGRRVDVAISATDQPGAVALDYLITENRPLVLYAEVANTGTKQTERLRERLGLVHTQLTNRDDILTLDYVTTLLDQVNAFSASYEAPFADRSRLRWRAHGSWSEFTASEVGFFNDVFTGETAIMGGELIANIHQDRTFFIDLVGGFQVQRIDVDNQAVGVAGQEDFFLTHVGIRLEQQTRRYSLLGSVLAEWNDGQEPQPDPAQLSRLGRVLPDANFGVVRWSFSGSAYLEPLLNREAWLDPMTPRSSTLAHEVTASFRGQYAFGNRLVPQFEQVVGGLHSVRGYPESVAAGDSALVASVEYRYHLPRALEIQPTPGELFGEPFRIAPQNVYGRPDWDLVFRTFFDIGRTFVSDALFFENEETLMGAGVGVDFVLKRDLSLRVDWGFALSDLESGAAQAGSNRVHFLARIFF